MYYVYVTMQYSLIMHIFSSRIVNFWNSPLCMVAEDDETNYSDYTGAGRSRNPPSRPRIVCDAPWSPNRRVCGASSTANRRREWPEWRPPRRTFKTRERERRVRWVIGRAVCGGRSSSYCSVCSWRLCMKKPITEEERQALVLVLELTDSYGLLRP